jgi:hypothetical protein
MASEELYRVDSGDGDPRFFGAPLILKRTNASWFPDRIPEWGKAMLFMIMDGPLAGEYIALTSRTTDTLEEQFVHGGASAVVHQIKNPTISFGKNESDFHPVGMAYVEVVDASGT